MIAGQHEDPVAAWRQATLAGNAHFELGQDGPARACYERAHALALHRATRWPRAIDGLAALVVSTLNLAEVLLRSGDADEACHLTCALHRSLANAAGNGALTPAWRDAARGHLLRSFAALVHLENRVGQQPSVSRLLRQAGPGESVMTRH